MAKLFSQMILTIIFFLLASLSVWAGDGGLTPKIIDNVEAKVNMDNYTRSIYNALTNTDINNLALNRDILNAQNNLFSNKIKTKSITNQKSSGRCWLFAALNVLRPAVIDKYKIENFEFSQNFLSFWDKLEKANCFLEYAIEFRNRDTLDRELELILKDPIGDGGWWEYAVDLIEKYGAVPKEIMPETNSSENTGAMNNLIIRRLRANALKIRSLAQAGKNVEQLRSEKETMLGEIYRMLVINLGCPPEEFEYRYQIKDSTLSESKKYTPLSFYKDFVDIDLREYVGIFNDPSKAYGKHYQMRMGRNMYDRPEVDYVNANIGILKEAAQKMIVDSQPVWFICEVGVDQNSNRGLMAVGLYDYNSIYNINFNMTKAECLTTRETTTSHAMVLVGVDIRDGKTIKWQVENSWGSDNKNGGYWTLYDDWFDENVYSVVVKKKYLSEDILKIFKEEPIIRPAWDIMAPLFH
jgi:bleomycin hydrolase